MAKSEVLRKTIHYKRANWLQKGGNLQKQLKAALDRAGTVGKRKQTISASENTVLLVNGVRPRWGMLFGSMLTYSRGRNQPLVTEDDAADELTVEQLRPPPSKTGAQRDFIESLLFFGIKDNHAILLQSAGLRARQFENHLNWLLQERTKVMDDEDRVELADRPSQKAVNAVLQSPVRNVTVGLPLEASPRKAKSGGMEKVSFEPSGVGFDLLKRILGVDWLNRVRLSDTLDETKLKVEVNVSYPRATDDDAQELLNDIAVQMRHQEPEDVVIRLKNGVKLAGDDLKLAGPVSVQAYGGLVDPEDLFPRMRDWLREQFELGILES